MVFYEQCFYAFESLTILSLIDQLWVSATDFGFLACKAIVKIPNTCVKWVIALPLVSWTKIITQDQRMNGKLEN